MKLDSSWCNRSSYLSTPLRLKRQSWLQMLLALTASILVSLWCLCPVSYSLPTVVGIFSDPDDADLFTKAMQRGGIDSNSTRVLSLTVKEAPGSNITHTLCEEDELLFVYIVASRYTIQSVASIAIVRNFPVFAYDIGQKRIRSKVYDNNHMVFYTNNFLNNEGEALARIAIDSRWKHIKIICQSNLQYDGLIESFRTQFSKNNIDDYMLLYDAGDSSASVLIQLQQQLQSTTEKGYMSYDVVLLHMPPDMVREVLTGAELIFHDKDVIWLITSVGEPLNMLKAQPGLLTLVNHGINGQVIEKTVQLINDEMMKIITPEGNISSLRPCKADLELDYFWIRSMAKLGLTSQNQLRFYQFEVLTSKVDSWTKIGSIDSINDQESPSVIQAMNKDKSRETYTVVTIADKPFMTENVPSVLDGVEYCQTPSILCLKIPQKVIINHGYSSDIVRRIYADFSSGIRSPNRTYSMSCCEGLAMDLLQSLSAELEFDYQLYVSPDGKFGAYDPNRGNWTGMVKELIDGRADMVMASFSITSPRSTVIDYSAPYYHSGFALLSIEREAVGTNYFSFLDPYGVDLWAMILVAAVVTFLSMAFFEWASPYGTNPKHEDSKASYTLSSGVKAVFSLLCGNTIPSKTPQSSPGKLLQLFWGFFSIIYISTYTANLTSSLAGGTTITKVNGIYDDKLLELRVAGTSNAAAENYVKLIKPQLYEKMRKYDIDGTDAGIKALRNNELDVYAHDTPVIDYIVSQENFDCKLSKLGTFAVDSYGSGFPRGKNTDLKDAITSKFFEYQESGYIEKLRKIYFPPSSNCIQQPTTSQAEYSPKNASGLFFMLILFIVICTITLGIEHLIYKFVIPYAKRKPPSSCWKGQCLKFISQRAYRAILKNGNEGLSVFKTFARRLVKGTQLFSAEKLRSRGRAASTILKMSLSKKKPKMSFYEVVSLAYERSYRRPLEIAIIRPKLANTDNGVKLEHQIREKPAAMHVIGSVSQVALATCGLGNELRRKDEYFQMLDDSIKNKRISNGCHSNGAYEMEEHNTEGVAMSKPVSLQHPDIFARKRQPEHKHGLIGFPQENIRHFSYHSTHKNLKNSESTAELLEQDNSQIDSQMCEKYYQTSRI